MNRKICNCFEPQYSNKKWLHELRVHDNAQDYDCAAWQDLLVLINEAMHDKREEFNPKKELGAKAWSCIETLPKEISKLKDVRHLVLYGSNVTWIPPEIGNMTALEEFTPYNSYRLHWFPYEITQCENLKLSTVSTRALYGNYKYRSPFPKLRGNPVRLYDAKCSVCKARASKLGLNQLWISLKVATDVLPLLVHTCSKYCLESLPTPPKNYINVAHKGGLGRPQPKRIW